MSESGDSRRSEFLPFFFLRIGACFEIRVSDFELKAGTEPLLA